MNFLKKRTLLASLAGIVLIAGAFLLTHDFSLPEEENKNNGRMEEFVECLKEEGVIIFGSSTCPACKMLEEEYGGYEVIKPIYLDCSTFGEREEVARCREEMETDFVPEVQIKGEVFKEWGSPENLAKETGCEL